MYIFLIMCKIGIQGGMYMYCHQCGKEVGDAKYCPYCGAQLEENVTQGYYQPIDHQYQNNVYQNSDDQSSIGYALLSFFIPIAGIILFAVWGHEYPRRAKSCLKGFISGIVFYIVMICWLLSIVASMPDNDYYEYDDPYYEYSDFVYDESLPVMDIISYE